MQASISGGGLRALLKGGGGNALYAGVWGNLAGVVPASAIFMGVYEPVKQHIAKKVPENRQYLAALGGGALAGFAASFIRVPTEVVKQRLQTGSFCTEARTVEYPVLKHMPTSVSALLLLPNLTLSFAWETHI